MFNSATPTTKNPPPPLPDSEFHYVKQWFEVLDRSTAVDFSRPRFIVDGKRYSVGREWRKWQQTSPQHDNEKSCHYLLLYFSTAHHLSFLHGFFEINKLLFQARPGERTSWLVEMSLYMSPQDVNSNLAVTSCFERGSGQVDQHPPTSPIVGEATCLTHRNSYAIRRPETRKLGPPELTGWLRCWERVKYGWESPTNKEKVHSPSVGRKAREKRLQNCWDYFFPPLLLS